MIFFFEIYNFEVSPLKSYIILSENILTKVFIKISKIK